MTIHPSAGARRAPGLLVLSCWVVCLLLLPLSARAQVVVLHADFDHDTVGEMPTTDLPGDPNGDSLQRTESGGRVRVAASFGDMNDQPCVVSRTRNGYQIYLAGLVDPDFRDCDWYRVTWRGAVGQVVQFFYMTFASSNNQILASVEYRGGGQQCINGSQNVISTTYTPLVSQLFDLELDLTTMTANLSIDGQPVPEAQGVRFINVYPDGLRYIGTSFGMLDLYSVAIDDLHVVADGCPALPVQGKQWGALKAMYH